MVNIPKNQVRIIGGRLRGRKLPFPGAALLRPTPDRIKETVFNWLQPSIIDAKCMDCFAGTGAMGIESISRGAKHSTLIEHNRDVFSALKQNTEHLCITEQITCIQEDTRTYLQQFTSTPYDLIFLDPPYVDNLINQLLEWLRTYGWIHQHSFVYWEHNTIINPDSHWRIHRIKKAGQVHYGLLVPANA